MTPDSSEFEDDLFIVQRKPFTAIRFVLPLVRILKSTLTSLGFEAGLFIDQDLWFCLTHRIL